MFLAIANSSVAGTPTLPSGYTGLIDFSDTDGTHAEHVMVSFKEVATAGADNPAAYSGLAGQTADSWCAATVILRPAPGGTARVRAAGYLVLPSLAPTVLLTIRIQLAAATCR